MNIMEFLYIVIVYGFCFMSCMLTVVSAERTMKAATASIHQEHLLRHLSEYEIDYPIETNHRGRYIRHVTSTDHRQRMRRSLDVDDGPVFYNIRYQGNDYHMRLRHNERLFSKSFTVERHKEGGIVEKTRLIEHCYLVGETTYTNLSAAISNCDGLSGAIETPDDVLFIEPIINETAVKTNKKGRPHLIYRQSMIKKMKNVAHDMQGDTWRPRYSSGTSARKRFRAAKSFIKIINRTNRSVKVYYVDGGKEKLFSDFPINDEQGINTFTSHRWVARDSTSGKQLLIDGQKIYKPKANSEYSRTTVDITIPKGLKLPKYNKPLPPDAYLKIINKSGRFVQIYYHDGSTDSAKKLFVTAAPNDVTMVSTYTSHRWFVNDYDTGKPLWLNTRQKLIPVRSTKWDRLTVIITVPLNLVLPKPKFPDMLDDETKYIEAMVTADASVVKHHGKDKVQRYILTLMNIVSRIFEHPSLGVKINVVVTRLMILETNPSDLVITRSPAESLTTVCTWGHKMRKGWDKTSKTFHDQTIFLTRSDFGPSGYAPVASMCYRTKSCTLNEDDGFPSSFIVAHETGHTLGMEHDGYHNNCTKDTVKGSVMAPLVRSKFDRFYWSACSRRELIDHLDTLWCLEDKPHNFNREIMKQLPGQIYDLDEQCKMDFGQRFSSCSNPYGGGQKCDKLWCDEYSYSSWCRTRNTPPLEGTTCGKRKWCRYGHCVPMTRGKSFELPTPKPTPKPINGGWSGWSAFAPCSMTCGKGIKVRARACNNPKPYHGGLPCAGLSMDIAFCIKKPCTEIQSTFEQVRHDQCRNRGSKNSWTFYDVYNTKLDCDFENGLCGWEQDKHDDFDWTLLHGRTPSSKTGPSYDHTLGYGKKGTYLFVETSRPTDVGWRARLISKLVAKHVTCLSFWYHAFGDDDHFGHFEVLVNTTEKEKVLWSHSGNKGDRWFHKHTTILSVTPYRVVFQAMRGDGYLADMAIDDIKFTDGPCKLDISVPLEKNTYALDIPLDPCKTYCMSKKSGNVYKFPVKDGARCYENPAILDVCVKGRCKIVGCDGKIGSNVLFDNCGICDGINDTCALNKGTVDVRPGKGDHEVLQCPVGASNIMVEALSANKHHLVVESAGDIHEAFINGGANMSDPGVYNIGGTEFFYSRNNKSEKILARGPIKENLVVKIKKPQQSGLIRYQFYKPNKQPTIYIWKSMGWTNCSNPCGGGIEERILECIRKKDNIKVKEKYCFGITQPKPSSKNCNMKACPIYFKWNTDKWGPCSVTCSQGIRKRRVYCERSTYGEKTKLVLSFNCKEKKPITTEKCVKRVCEAMWVPGPWGKCSKSCGRGIRTRTVKCISKDGKPSWKCTEKSKLPIKGHCDMITCVPDVPVVLGNLSCTFEAGFCRWRNTRKADDFDWRLGRGNTRSRFTGPTKDHTFGTNKGKYMYIEASAPRNPGDKAKILSPLIDISKICLEFYFNMLGDKMGTLNVLLESKTGEKRLWFKKGNQGGRWNLVRLQITSSVAYKIIFEAIRGDGFSGDAAVDDVTIYQGKCPVTKFVKYECYGDTSRLCVLAVRYKWCSAKAWGEYLCCSSCAKEVKYRQRRKTPKHALKNSRT